MNPSTTPTVNPNAAFMTGTDQAAINATFAPISVSSVQSPTPPITVPPQPPVNTGAAANASVPIPSIESITGASTTPTDTDIQQSSLLSKIADLTNSPSLSTLQATNETAAGIPAINKTIGSLSAQLQGYSDQSSKLALDASAGGTIQNLVQNKAQGTNDTGGGLAPIQADQLRANQIQQATIAGQSLTTKAALYAAQNDYSNAKSAADQAAQVTFDATTQAINHQQALLAAIKPQLDKEQAARAATLSAELADRATQVANQREDFKTGQSLAIAAMQNNPNDPAALFAAQEALKLDPKSPTYLQDVANLVGKYQDNQTKESLALKLQQAQINEANANTAKTYNDIKLTGDGNNGTTPGTTGSPTIDVTSEGYSTTPIAGGLTQASIDQKALSYITSGTLPPQGRTGAAGAQNAAISNRMAEMAPGGNLAGNKAQLKSYSDSLNTQQKYLDSTQRAFNTANQNLTTLTGFMTKAGINTDSSIPLLNSIQNGIKAGVLDPGSIGGYNAAIAGLRAEYAQVLSRGGEVTEGQRSQANSLIPDNLTPSQLQQVADRLNAEGTNAVNEAQGQVTKIQGQINDIISPKAASTTVQSNGSTYNVGVVYNDGTANWTVDANGKWTKQ